MRSAIQMPFALHRHARGWVNSVVIHMGQYAVYHRKTTRMHSPTDKYKMQYYRQNTLFRDHTVSVSLHIPTLPTSLRRYWIDQENEKGRSSVIIRSLAYTPGESCDTLPYQRRM